MSFDFRPFIEALRIPVTAGAPELAVEAVLESSTAEPTHRRRLMYAALHQELEAQPLPDLVRPHLARTLGRHRDPHPVLQGQLAQLAEFIRNDGPKSVDDERVGVAQILFVAKQEFLGAPFGAVHAVEVARSSSRDGIDLAVREEHEFSSFSIPSLAGAQIIRDWVAAEGASLGGFGIRGCYPTICCPVYGSSQGLGVACATMSAVLDQPISNQVGFTGMVDWQGNIRPVAGLHKKLEAAVRRGLAIVYCARGTLEQLDGAVPAGLRIEECADLRLAATKLFGEDRIRRGIERLRTEACHRGLGTSGTIPTNWGSRGRRVLLSFVGKSDPLGVWKDRSGKPIRTDEGPVLTARRAVDARTVYLLHTVGAGSSDYGAPAALTRELLDLEDSNLSVVLRPMPTLEDPTDFAAVYEAMVPVLSEIAHEHRSDDIFINLTSGTPVMFGCWVRAVERGVLRPAGLAQVREQRFVPVGESRVRFIKGIG